MSRVRICHAAGVSLILLLAGTTVVEAQRQKPRLPTRTGAPGRPAPEPAAGQPSGPQVATGATQVVKALMPCCVLEKVETSLRGGSSLVIKNTSSGAVHRVKLSSSSVGKVGSAASSAKYRPGQRVDMNIDKTAMAITPFPVNDSKESKIKGKSSWKMWTDVTVSNNGRIDGRTRIKSSEAARGFTGGVEVVLTDRQGNILHQTALRKYGVNGTAMGGKSDRTVKWNETVPADALNKVSAVVIYHSYEPKVRLAAGIGWIKDNWKLVHKVYKCGRELLEADEDGAVASAPPPPPPPGQPTSQSQPPASDTSAMECLEATEELAKQLGY